MHELIDDVADLIREVATVEVLDRFQALADDDVEEKSPGDLVTIADRECERLLGAELRVRRDAPVIGEEAAELDPELPGRIEAVPAAWIVDPVDGTGNFVKGSPDFAVMVAYVERGETVASWIWVPVPDRMVCAVRGAGAWSNGDRLQAPAPPPTAAGLLKHRYIPEPARTRFDGVAAELELADDRRCAGVEYLDLVDGASSFLTYWRTKPWDHAPGTLIAEEAGLRAGRFDGSPYRPGDGGVGLLTCAPDRWDSLAPPLLRAATG